MKRILTMVLCIFLLSTLLTGCGKGVKQINEELNIHVTYNGYEFLTRAIDLFEQQNKDVKVNIQFIEEGEEEQYFYVLQAGLMTGKDIPDLLFIDKTFTDYCDVNKMQQSGAFIDMNTKLQGDNTIDLTRYHTPIIESLRYDGKQYLFPYAYDLPLVMSTEEKLAELGMTVKEFRSLGILDFFRMLNDKSTEYNIPMQNLAAGRLQTNQYRSYMEAYANWIFPQSIDYKERTLSLDTVGLQNMIEALDLISKEAVNNNDFNYFYFAAYMNELSLRNYTQFAVDAGETPVLTCLTDANGEINVLVNQAFAIPQMSPNQENAYKLMKLALSDAVLNHEYGNPILSYDFVVPNTPIIRNAAPQWNTGIYVGAEQNEIHKQYQAYQNAAAYGFVPSKWSDLVMTEAQDYYIGNSSLEKMMVNLEDILRIYVSE